MTATGTTFEVGAYYWMATRDHTGRRQTGYHQIVADMGGTILTRPVDRYGNDRSHYTDGTLVDVQALIGKDCITGWQHATMNIHYAELQRQTPGRRPPAEDGPMTDQPGTLYLIHFSGTLGTSGRNAARHYFGWADDLDRRVAEHRAGTGARITAAAVAAGMALDVVWTAPGTRTDERRAKRNGHHDRRCVVCRAGREIPAGTLDLAGTTSDT